LNEPLLAPSGHEMNRRHPRRRGRAVSAATEIQAMDARLGDALRAALRDPEQTCIVHTGFPDDQAAGSKEGDMRGVFPLTTSIGARAQ
jgi:hypothetical protein